MSPNEAAKILERLAQGVDPQTGELLHRESVLHEPAVIRALFIAVRRLEDLVALQPPERPRDPAVPQAGKPWTPEEADRLLASFDAGVSIEELAQQHGRTKGAIAARLVRLGRIDERSEVYQREKRAGTHVGE